MELLQTETLNIDEFLDIRPMNDWMREAGEQPVPKQLFDDLWCEGELSLLFGDTGKGKSALAVQIGESIARGRAMHPFGLTAKPRNVLLLDFEMTEKQIEMRYSADHEPSKGDVLKKKYAFSKRFHRMVVRPEMLFRNNGQPIEDILRELLQPLIVKTRATVLIIDNITHMKRTADSYRETVPLIKELLRLKRRFGLSILAIAHTRKRDVRRGMTINDLLSAGTLANSVDNIFAIGQSRRDPGERYIKHLKPRNAEALYDGDHVPAFRLSKIGGNFLGFEFTEFASERVLLAEPKDGPNWPLIEKIKQMHDDGDTIRGIAIKLGMSKTVVHRHLQMWRPPEEEETAPVESAAEEKPFDPTKKAFYFPGCEEYDAATKEIWGDDEDEDEDDDDDLVEETETERLFRYRQAGVVEHARADARREYERSGFAPKLADNLEYQALKTAIREYYDSGGMVVQEPIAHIVRPFYPRVSSIGLVQPPATAGGTDVGGSASSDPPDELDPLAAMPTELDARRELIYVEDHQDDGQPRVWYKYESDTLFRYQRDPSGITRTRADAEVFGKFVKRE